jgi:hypothetical protein
MDFIKSKLSSIGALLAVFGIASAVLSFFDYNLKLLMWVDLWGTTMGWVIRVALIVVGGALFLGFNKSEDEEEAAS